MISCTQSRVFCLFFCLLSPHTCLTATISSRFRNQYFTVVVSLPRIVSPRWVFSAFFFPHFFIILKRRGLINRWTGLPHGEFNVIFCTQIVHIFLEKYIRCYVWFGHISPPEWVLFLHPWYRSVNVKGLDLCASSGRVKSVTRHGYRDWFLIWACWDRRAWVEQERLPSTKVGVAYLLWVSPCVVSKYTDFNRSKEMLVHIDSCW